VTDTQRRVPAQHGSPGGTGRRSIRSAVTWLIVFVLLLAATLALFLLVNSPPGPPMLISRAF
jgi:hypothetical protein